MRVKLPAKHGAVVLFHRWCRQIA